MATTSKDPKNIDTGGGAFVGGSVTAGGDFVGRDQVKTVQGHREGASTEELTGLLAEIRALLPQAGVEADVAEVIEGDFRVVEAQMAKEEPKGGLVKARLKAISDVIQETGKVSVATEKILKLLGKGVALAGTLF
jgi:hypothetical protein